MTGSRRLFDAIGAQLVLHRQLGEPAPRVGDYVIEAILGAGGFGLICRATQEALRRPVALKLFPLDVGRPGEAGAAGESGVREALREARSLARLDHPNVVRVYAAGEAELIASERLACAFVEMQLIDGVDLRTWIERSSPDAATVLEVLIAAGRALAHAHAAGVLHRDFKPENLMIDGHGRPTVIDFGLALVAEGELAADPELARWTPGVDGVGTRATGAGLVRGTPGYMAPEAAIGRPRAGSDQFAFAVVVREALTGRHPFASEGEQSPAPVGGPELFARIKPALDRAMAPTPDDRYPSLAAACDELVTLGVRVGDARPRPRWPWQIALGSGLAATLGLGGWLVLAGPSAREPADRAAPATEPDPGRPAREPVADATARPSPDDAEPIAAAAPEPPDPSPSPAPAGCAELEAWAGAWEATTRVTWTEYAYQHDWRVDYGLELTIGERCSVTVTARKYPPMIAGELPGTPVEASTAAVAVREASGIWRLPLRLRFAGDTRTYAAEESYETVLILDRASPAPGEPASPRVRGAFRKLNDDGRWIRLGLLAAERGVPPDPRSLTPLAADLTCATRCRLGCAGATAEADCYARGCAPVDPSDPADVCGPPSYDFRAPMRAIAARESLLAGNNPFAQALERGNRAKQLADCARNAAALAGEWGVWIGERRVELSLRSDGCELGGILREPSPSAAEPGPAPEPEPRPSWRVDGYVTAAGTWVIQPAADRPSWLPPALVLVGVGEAGPAFGTDTHEPATSLRAYRRDRRTPPSTP